MTGAVTGVVTGAGAPRDGVDPDTTEASPFEWPGGAFEALAGYVDRSVGEARVIDVRASPLLLRETAAFARATPPRVMLQAVIDGRPVYHDGRGGQFALRPGALIIRRADEAASIHGERFARVVSVALAQHLLVPRFATTAALDHCAVQTDSALPQRLLHSFLVGLVEPNGAPWLNPRGSIIDGIGGLVSMIAAQTPQPRAELSELAAERAGEILRHLRRNFANPQLTPSVMAEDLNISVRYIHKLMQLTGRSFREELVALRLEAARLAFAANSRPRQTIADIAISVGFNDLSQFNRHFRAAFGITPRAARRLDETSGYDPDTLRAGRWAAGEVRAAEPAPTMAGAGASLGPLSMAAEPG